MNHYYVYLLLDPRRFYLPFYVGKGSGKRAWTHINKQLVRDENPFKSAVIAKIEGAGLKPAILIWQANLEEIEAYALEERLIARFGRRIDGSGVLTNISVTKRPPSSKGRKMSEATKQKIREANTGKKRTLEQRLAMSDSRKGRKRKPHTEESKQKIREGNLGKVRRKWTDEERARHSEITKKQWENPNRRILHSLAFENKKEPD